MVFPCHLQMSKKIRHLNFTGIFPIKQKISNRSNLNIAYLHIKNKGNTGQYTIVSNNTVSKSMQVKEKEITLSTSAVVFNYLFIFVCVSLSTTEVFRAIFKMCGAGSSADLHAW